MDEEEEIAQEPEEESLEEEEVPQEKPEKRHDDLPRLEELLKATSVVEESKRGERSIGNKSEFKKVEQEKENESLVERQKSHIESDKK